MSGVEEVLRRLEGVKKSGGGWTARCPAHDDRHASLSIGIGVGGRTLLKCHAGCASAELLAAVGLTFADIAPKGVDLLPALSRSPRSSRLPSEREIGEWRAALLDNQKAVARLMDLRGWTLEAITDLGLGLDKGRVVIPVRDATGDLVSVLRYLPGGGLRGNEPKMRATPGSRRELFPGPETLNRDGNSFVFLVEGEPDAIALHSLGLSACGVPGVQGWRPEWRLRFAGLRVCVVFDCDEPGRQAAWRVAVDLAPVTLEVRVLDLNPSRRDGHDLTDFLHDARDDETRKQAMRILLQSAERAELCEPDAVNAECRIGSELTASNASRPAIDEAAFIGLTAEVARAWADRSEVDPVAVLVQMLAVCGLLLGRGPHIVVGPQSHHAALNLLIVGPTSTGRKGESFAAAERVAERVAEDFPLLVIAGLGSGEALIEAVRDPKRGSDADGESIVVEPGVTDKRRLFFAPEFARVLKVCRKDTSILGTILREAWDGRRLQTLTRSAPLVATGYHIAVIAQITPAEFQRLLDATEAANGFLNRFLTIYSERPRLTPFAESPDPIWLEEIASHIRQALAKGRDLESVELAADAKARWATVYPHLSRDRGGLVGELCARHAPIALRLSLIYAILDGAESIHRPHLDAALAVCRYAEESARHIFGDTLGAPLADRALKAIRERPGITREELRSEVFNRNFPATEVDRALVSLTESKLVETTVLQTAGRPATAYWPTQPGDVKTSH